MKFSIPILFLLFLLFLSTWGSTELILYSNHSIKSLPNWVTYKSIVRQNLLGMEDYRRTRVPIAKNRINLDSWHGHNGIFYNRIVKPIEFSFDAYLLDSDDAEPYFLVVFGFTNNGFHGIRLSENKAISSMFFRASREGEYLEKRPLKTSDFHGWNRYRILLNPDNLKLYLNEKIIFEKSLNSPVPEGLVGLISGGPEVVIGPSEDSEGGHWPSITIDNFSIRTQDWEFSENFSNRTNLWEILFITFIFHLLVIAFCFLFFYRTGKHIVISVLLLLILMINYSLIYVVDYYRWSGQYHIYEEDVDNTYYQAINWKIESARRVLFDILGAKWLRDNDKKLNPLLDFSTYDQDVDCRFTNIDLKYIDEHRGEQNADYSKIHCPEINIKSDLPVLRIGFIGSSQTYGDGAYTEKSSWVSKFTHKLSGTLTGKCRLEVINMAQPGAFTEGLSDMFSRIQTKLKFDYIFINLAHNDTKENLQKYYRKLVDQVIDNGATPVLVLEAISSLDSLDPKSSYNEKLDVIRKIAKAIGLKPLEFNAYMNSEKVWDTGLLWVDDVHLSQMGQNLAANWVHKEFTEKYHSLCE